MSCINFIPSEIIEAILLRLPPHSLGRFKSVSKTWNSLISNPRIIKTHTHQLLHQPKKKLLAFDLCERSLYSIELTIDNIINSIQATAKEITFNSPPPVNLKELLGSCNGLVLARDVKKSIFLMNPTTLDLCRLPANPLVYDTDMCFACYGFGYDLSTDGYKVVLCLASRTAISDNNSVSIYSLRNNSWRKLPDTRHNVKRSVSCALVNGKCHWLAKNSRLIIAFSFVDELFSEIKPPDSILISNLWTITDVVEIGGRLGVYLGLKSGDSELWVMQEYGDAKSWTRAFSHEDYMRPLCLVEGSDRDVVFDYVDRVGVFNMDQGRCRNIRIVGDSCRFILQGSFVETIESTKRIIKTP